MHLIPFHPVPLLLSSAEEFGGEKMVKSLCLMLSKLAFRVCVWYFLHSDKLKRESNIDRCHLCMGDLTLHADLLRCSIFFFVFGTFYILIAAF